MDISVIVCTCNRAETLRNALEAIAESSLPASVSWEILVVDNNSKDKTREVVDDVSQAYPNRLRYILESRPGKSFALNTGIRSSTGKVLAFADDDVTVASSWLENLTRHLFDSRWYGAGGRTLPTERVSLPKWLSFDGPYGMGGIMAAFFDLGVDAMALDRPPYGANMAYKREAFDEFGGFRVDLGPSPDKNTPRPNEDTEFGRRVMAAGHRLIYEPGAIAYHPVLKERISKKYFLDWWFDFGRAQVREMGPRYLFGRIPRFYLSIPNNILRALPLRTLRWMLIRDPARRFYYRCLAQATVGTTVEIWRQARRMAPAGPRAVSAIQPGTGEVADER